MGGTIPKELLRLMYKQFNEEKKDLFMFLGKGGQYTESQKRYAFELIKEHGMRATARILDVPRRTLQRWCRQYGIYVKRCPIWVHDWAERRRKKRRFWLYRGYG